MSGSGFEEILEESLLYGTNHITGILKGKHYYRGVNAHKQLVESMIQLYWKSFKNWMKQKFEDYPHLEIIFDQFYETAEPFVDDWSRSGCESEVKITQYQVMH